MTCHQFVSTNLCLGISIPIFPKNNSPHPEVIVTLLSESGLDDDGNDVKYYNSPCPCQLLRYEGLGNIVEK
jgi:hypothetical protein